MNKTHKMLAGSLAGIVAAGVCGAAALIVSPSLASSTGETAQHVTTAAQTGNADRRGRGLVRTRRILHASWVTRDKVEHRAIRGTVTQVSAQAISLKAADGVSETYAVTGETVVRIRKDGKGEKGSISDVHRGDRALVVGKGAHAAIRVLARAPKTSAQDS